MIVASVSSSVFMAIHFPVAGLQICLRHALNYHQFTKNMFLLEILKYIVSVL